MRKTARPRTGYLLVAKPFWGDFQYNRSVILVIEHNKEGSVGLIINKESTLNIGTAVKDLESNLPVYYGGPFKKEIIFVLHNEPDIPDSIDLGNEIFVGGDYDFLKDLINNHLISPNRIRFCAGYVVWSAGQLEKELKTDKWWSSKITANEFFNTDADSLWSHELAKDGHIYSLFDNFPDPSLS